MSKSVTLKLVGEISDESARLLVDQISAVPANTTIELRIASTGGSIFAGQRIITALRERSGEATTFNESSAAGHPRVDFALGTKRTVARKRHDDFRIVPGLVECRERLATCGGEELHPAS